MICFLNANNFSKDILAQGTARPSGTTGKTERSRETYLEMRSHFGTTNQIPETVYTPYRLMAMEAMRHVPEWSKWNNFMPSGTFINLYCFAFFFMHGKPCMK